MIRYKTQEEIEEIAEGGKYLSQTLDEVVKIIKPGVGTKQLNDLAEKMIKDCGGKPSFKGFRVSSHSAPFPTGLCTSINNELVHGPAEPDRKLIEGDIIGLDIGMEYKGFFTDMARTVAVGKIDNQVQKLLDVTKEALNIAISNFKEGNYLSDIGKAVSQYIEENNFSVVKELIGHGVGHAVHEDPRVPNYVTEESKHIKIKKGMVIAIEPMVNVGDWKLKVLDDDFTYATADDTLSAQFEHTVAIDHHGMTRILTKN